MQKKPSLLKSLDYSRRIIRFSEVFKKDVQIPRLKMFHETSPRVGFLVKILRPASDHQNVGEESRLFQGFQSQAERFLLRFRNWTHFNTFRTKARS